LRAIKTAMIRTVEVEFNESELTDLVNARVNMRAILSEQINLDSPQRKALEDSIYLISTVLGNHQ
jgi:hypothetical protein